MKEMKTLNGYEVVDGWAREQIERINGATNDPTDAKYFDIDANGVISLKSQYRGRAKDASYPYATSDVTENTGVAADGSEIGNLPKRIVLPDVINGVAVKSLADGMFYENYAVEEIAFPSTIAVIPAYFCYYAKRLRSIKNTEHITSVGTYGFAKSRVEEAIFPRLKTLGTRAFWGCALLHTADIGNEVTELPERCFMNTKLSTFVGGENVTTIGFATFYGTHYLTRLPFLDLLKVRSVANICFANSHVQFDWAKLTNAGCTFEVAATPVSDNVFDYWSNVIGNGYFTPCENHLVSTFHQKHPLWTNAFWGNTDKKYNCAIMGVIHIHSALSGRKYATPFEFEEEVRNEHPELLDIHPSEHEHRNTFFQTLGYETNAYITTSTDDVKLNEAAFRDILDSLKNGDYAYISVGSGTEVNGGHGVVGYGVDNNGDIMFLDSDVPEYNVDLYGTGLTYAMPLQNTTGPYSTIIIVRKP